MRINTKSIRLAYFLLLPLFFIFHEFVQHFFLISVTGAIGQLLVYLVCSIVIAFLVRLYFRDTGKALFYTFFLMAMNFFFGYLHDAIRFLFPASFIVKYSFILSLLAIMFVVFAVFLKKSRSLSSKIVSFLNLLLIVLLIIDAGTLLYKIAHLAGEKKDSLALRYSSGESKPPDVYFIITDEYAGDKDLKEVCNFDNKLFLDSLSSLGFFVAKNSISNYNYTVHSMGSILNMDYVKGGKDPIVKALPLHPLKLIYENKVTESFKNAGYEIYNYSAFDIKNYPSENPNMFVPANTRLFTSQTLISRIKKDAFLSVAINMNIESIVKSFAYENLHYNEGVYNQTVNLLNVQHARPRFVYTHLEMPHFPYYYDGRAELFTYEKLRQYQPGDTAAYVGYLKYTNSLLLNLVNEILLKSKAPPIIILMSDHGYRSYPGDQVSYSFLNLFSVYFNDKNYSVFNDSLSGVNVFRAIFNAKFGQNMPMLRDSTFDVR